MRIPGMIRWRGERQAARKEKVYPFVQLFKF